jgi:hypothetical protein
MSTDPPYVAVLAANDWWPLSKYVPSKHYVYLQGCAQMANHPAVTVARRGRHELSYWYSPDGQPLSIAATVWKPLSNDRSTARQIWKSLYATPGAPEPYTRPPEEVYQPAGMDARLTPVPRELLADMYAGAILRERAWRWTEWTFWLPSEGPSTPINHRGTGRLRELAFIERNGVLPPGRPDR